MRLIPVTIILFGIFSVHCDLNEVEEVYLKFYIQLENVKKSLDILKVQMDKMDYGRANSCASSFRQDSFEELQKSRNRSKPVFDARVDLLPRHCPTADTAIPSNCAKATQCTETSGYYNISIAHYSNHTFPAFCDYRTEGGDWLYILQRIDGTVDFSRPWSDYVNGFGEVDGEYWIGLENLYALTNYDGPQELYVYMENFTGHSRYARYNHFRIGGAQENYKLKSLGTYSGNAGDSMEFSLGAEFSTYDEDRDTHKNNCALIHKGGWWYKNCARTVPTGFYHHGSYYKADGADGIYWRDWMELWNSMKIFVMKIRRQRIFLH